MEVSNQLHASSALLSGNSPKYLLYMRLCVLIACLNLPHDASRIALWKLKYTLIQKQTVFSVFHAILLSTYVRNTRNPQSAVINICM
jgi:hypothetical protein